MLAGRSPQKDYRMNRTPVNSSNLASVGYDASSSILEVEFLDNSVYQYFNVPNSIYMGLMSASSKGRYLDQNVKKAGYNYKKIR